MDIQQVMADELAAARAEFHALLDSLSEEDFRRQSLNPGWTNGEILAHMKNRGNRSMRNHLATRNLLTFGSEKIANQCVEAQIPDFATLMNVKRKAVA